jgi:hypothetical protein
LSRRQTPEQRRAKRERYASNLAAREEQHAGHVDSGLVAGHRHGLITGPYSVDHLRPQPTGGGRLSDPGLVAGPESSWAHLLPLGATDDRRRPTAVEVSYRKDFLDSIGVKSYGVKRDRIRSARRNYTAAA